MNNLNKKRALILSFTYLLLIGCAPNIVVVKKDSEIKEAVPEAFPRVNQINEDPFEENEEAEKKTGEEPLDNKESVTSFNKEKQLIKSSSGEIKWQEFFGDPDLKYLIDLALKNNQELNIVTQEINIAKNEMMARQGEYLPKLGLGGEAGVERVGKLTHQGVTDESAEYEPGQFVPRDLKHYAFGLNFSWEIDIWAKLRNATKSALYKYLASIDGKNFMVTKLVAEIANSYYELLALDQQLEIVEKNIKIQREAVKLVVLQQQAARVTSLAVKRFKAEVLKNRSRRYELRQKILQMENKINTLLGRYPQAIKRNATHFISMETVELQSGIPARLLEQRPDVRRAQNNLKASNLDIKVARAKFYPSLSIEASGGYESFNSKHLVEPESIFYNLFGNLTAPLLNRQAIKADYLSANSKQLQAVYDYEQVMIKAYTEVVNQMAKMNNLEKTYKLKSKQAELLTQSIDISNVLFKAARADYVEVLMTRRDALETQMELVEIKLKQMSSIVNLYQALGGGWQEEAKAEEG